VDTDLSHAAPANTERQVARHYTHGSLRATILGALTSMGVDIDNLRPDDLAMADEFHLGWRAATVEFAEALGLKPSDHVLDVGSGIGGPARFFAEAHGCRVTGIDLTEEFVAVAEDLTRRCGLADRVAFRQASALALPFEDAAFDVATMIHVGMNIADKAGVFAQMWRVLKAGGRFGVYDIMRMGDEALPYPMPWAQTPETSFVEEPATYRRLLEEAGFRIEKERNRRDFALRLGREMREDMARNGVPPLSLHILAGPAMPERLGNVMKALADGLIAPVEMITRKT
jgi:ubiquinone/menaquinone biosynthesis C-methylase UbiE